MQISTKTVVFLAATFGCITWAVEAAPLMNSTTDATTGAGNGSSAGSSNLHFEFRYNCSSLEVPSKNESNSTYYDFAIGLYVLKVYLKGVRSNLNTTIAMEDDESFIPCYPAPVDTSTLKLLTSLGKTATKARHVAAWHGVLAAYAEYAKGLIEDERNLPPHLAKKLNTVFEMLQSVLQLLTDVIGPLSCTNDFDIRHYEYTDHCTGFDTLKLTANMVTHLQTAVSDIQEVQRYWYVASSIGRYLQSSLVKELQPTWLSRYTTSC